MHAYGVFWRCPQGVILPFTAMFLLLRGCVGRGLPRPLPVQTAFALVKSVCLSVKQRATLLRGAKRTARL